MNNLEWRRSKVLELSSQGYTKSEIANTLQVSQPSVNRELTYLAMQAQENLRNISTKQYQKSTRNVW